MKKTTAQSHLKVLCECPNCDAYLDILNIEETQENLGRNLSAENIEIEIRCPKCLELFIITDITY